MSAILGSLRKKREDLLNKLSVIDEMIADELKPHDDNTLQTSQKTTLENIPPEDYKKKGSWPDKIGSIFRAEKRFLHLREISKQIQNYEPHFTDEKVLKQKLSANLNRMKNDGILTNKKIGDSYRNIFWGSVNWINSNGEIKEGYEFNPDVLYKKTKKIDLI